MIIGIDPHKASHTAVAIGGDEQKLAEGKIKREAIWALKRRSAAPSIASSSSTHSKEGSGRASGNHSWPAWSALHPGGRLFGEVTPGPTECYGLAPFDGVLIRRAHNPRNLASWLKGDSVSGNQMSATDPVFGDRSDRRMLDPSRPSPRGPLLKLH